MIRIRTNIGQVSSRILAKLNMLKDKEYLLRPVCIDLIPMMTKRIHQDGNASDGRQIGTYSDEYMRLRTGNYGNSNKISKGANKGKPKDSGSFSRGARAGQARPRYNRSADTKVIISLTRQLENGWSVIPTSTGYGIGFLNQHNADKAGWVEETYDKKIFSLTDEEKIYATEKLQRLVTDALNS